jgi:putative two-component system response regulator
MRDSGLIVVADDLEPNRALLTRLLTAEGHTVTAVPDGAAALAAIRRQTPDLVLSDVRMPHVDGFELCRQLKASAETRLIPVVLVTSLAAREHRLHGINAGADDFLTKPVDPHELRARVRSLISLKRFTDELDSAESVIVSLALTVEARDAYTAGHCERMAAYAADFGRYLGLSEEDIAALHRGGFLHDVGKVGIPDSVLSKPDRLTRAEFETMKAHTTIGDRLCGNLRLLRPVRPIVRSHHERLDGTGYPDGLAGDAVPLLAQVMGIVDVFDALTTDRPYRDGVPWDVACEILRTEVERGWRRSDLVEAFATLCASECGRMWRLAHRTLQLTSPSS